MQSTYLSEKIIKGGKGVWGEMAMAPHPTLAQSDVQQIVAWILSLGNKASTKKIIAGNRYRCTGKPINDQTQRWCCRQAIRIKAAITVKR